ncbi:MAG: hypothetical protein WBR15_06915 [Gammaproteobacteria bacterium]
MAANFFLIVHFSDVDRQVFTFKRLAALAAALAITACAGAPVQEMSNARQAVAAAQQMGAEHAAAREMAEARKLLGAAQAALDAGDYGTAREDAVHARNAAVKALRISEEQESSSPAPP